MIWLTFWFEEFYKRGPNWQVALSSLTKTQNGPLKTRSPSISSATAKQIVRWYLTCPTCLITLHPTPTIHSQTLPTACCNEPVDVAHDIWPLQSMKHLERTRCLYLFVYITNCPPRLVLPGIAPSSSLPPLPCTHSSRFTPVDVHRPSH